MIRTQDLSIQYGERILFEDVSIKFTQGNCYGLIGPNGAGKSTFIKVLSGEIEPHSGSVIIPPGLRVAVLRQDHFAFNRDFRFTCPRWPLYTPEGRPAPETLVRHSIVPLQRPSAQPVVTCGRLEALFSRHFSDTAPHVGHFFANRTALPVPRVSLPAPAAPRSAATCRRTAAGLDVLPPAGASSTWHASRAGPRSSPAAAGDS